MIAFYSTVLSLFVTAALIPFLAQRAAALGLLDRPGARKIHAVPVPRIGGIAIAAGALTSVAVWLPFEAEFVGYLVAAGLIALFGAVDDRRDLDYRLKFAVQVAGVLAFLLIADVHLTRAPFTYGGVLPDWVGLPLTLVVMVGVTNAVNLSDGMDGLAGGTTLLAAGAMGYLAYLGGDRLTALVALSVMGATLGFLRYNTHPARVFMGDAGSQFLGFSVAALGVLLVERANTAVSPLVPVLILALPITDTVLVMGRRMRAGRSPFSADRSHLHHRLLDLGFSQYEAVVAIYAIQVAFILVAWALLYAPDAALLGAYALLAGGIYGLVGFWETHRTAGRALLRRLDVVDQVVRFVRSTAALRRLGAILVTYGVALLLPLLALALAEVSGDLGWLALLLAAGMLLARPLGLVSATTTDRFAAFAASVALVYLAVTGELAPPVTALWLYGWLALVALGVALWLRFGDGRGFAVNGMDVLIALMVVIVPQMHFVRDTGLGPVFLGVLLLFYACEMILSARTLRWDALRVGLLAALGVLGMRGVLLPAL